MSTTEQPASGVPGARQLTLEELDSVVGGAASPAPDPHQFDKVAGFDTSHLHLDAAAMTSGKAEAEIAHAVQSGQANTTQALHLLEAVAVSDHTSVTQALSIFAGQVSGLPGHGNDAYAIGGEIASLITSNQVSAHQAMADIGNAVSAHALTGDQAMTLLEGVARHGDAPVQVAVGAEISALISTHQVTAESALVDIGMAVAGHSLSGAQALTVLTGIAGHGDTALQASVGGEIAELMQVSHSSDLPDGRTQALRPQDVMHAIDQAVASHTLSADQALALLIGMGASGNSAAQTLAHEEISALVHHGAVTLDHALEVLTALPASQQAVSGALTALMGQAPDGRLLVNVDHVISVLGGIAARGDAHFQIVLGGEMATAIGAMSPRAVMGAIDHAIASHTLSADQALALLVGMGTSGNSHAQTIAHEEISALVHRGTVTLDHALEVLTALPASQQAIGGALAALMGQAPDGRLLVNVDHVISVLGGIAARGDAHVQIALGAELAMLAKVMRPPDMMRAFEHAIASHTLTADQAVAVLSSIAAHGDINLQRVVAGEISSLIGHNVITTAQAETDIRNAVTSHILTPIQAAALWADVKPRLS